MFFAIALLITGSVSLITLSVVPVISDRVKTWEKKKEERVALQLDRLYYDKTPKQIVRLYFILPPVLAVAGAIFFRSILFIIGGALLGLFIPNLLLNLRDAKRRHKFHVQILDSIMILSSSLKGGLSLLQALEVLVEEIPAPMSQEVGLVVRENKMGVTLEDTLRHLDRRMRMDELSLVINSILVARETGGDLTKVFSRLSTTIRDNRKLKDSIKTLTLQGRLQGIIMSFLPIFFVWWVVSFNREHFNIMLQSDIGRILLFVAVGLQVVGMLLIHKFSSIRI
jgi:tight adherence protein B